MLFGTAGEEVGDIFTLIESKVEALARELRHRYGDNLDKMLEDMF
jgi:hypothetical protein